MSHVSHRATLRMRNILSKSKAAKKWSWEKTWKQDPKANCWQFMCRA